MIGVTILAIMFGVGYMACILSLIIHLAKEIIKRKKDKIDIIVTIIFLIILIAILMAGFGI
jgi:asparagine N-glycosylation enzyme membrane subunit Stt3